MFLHRWWFVLLISKWMSVIEYSSVCTASESSIIVQSIHNQSMLWLALLCQFKHLVYSPHCKTLSFTSSLWLAGDFSYDTPPANENGCQSRLVSLQALWLHRNPQSLLLLLCLSVWLSSPERQSSWQSRTEYIYFSRGFNSVICFRL